MLILAKYLAVGIGAIAGAICALGISLATVALVLLVKAIITHRK